MLTEFTAARTAFFGIPNGNTNTIAMSTPTFLKTLPEYTPGTPAYEAILNGTISTDPSIYDSRKTSKDIVYINWAVVAYAILDTPTSDSPWPPMPADGVSSNPAYFLAYHYEDWNRAIALLK